MLEAGAPPLLRTFPHVALKSLGGYEVDLLGKVLVGNDVQPPRYVSCREDDGNIYGLKAGAAPLLAEASDGRLAEIAAAWAAELDSPDSAENLLYALLRIRLLAIDAKERGGHVFTHTNL